MEQRTEMSPAEVVARFAEIWEQNYMDDEHPALVAAYGIADAERPVSTVYFSDVTLRDGQQQRTNEVTTEQRLKVFQDIVDTGVDRIEIGHLGNKTADQPLARSIIEYISKAPEGDRAHDVKLQVLFGSQPDIIEDGISVLSEAFQEFYGEDWRDVMNDKIVVHVYDRVHENLTSTSTNPYSQAESAERVSSTTQLAINAGFRNISISAEAASAVTPEDAIRFYRSITTSLFEGGAETVNVNLANTYGFSVYSDWNIHTLAAFNTAVKYGFDDRVTTSIHTHHDVDSAPDFTMKAVVAGFDRVESTHVGMGERAGNVAGVDVVARLMEQARQATVIEQRDSTQRSRIAAKLADVSLRRTVQVDPDVLVRTPNYVAVAKQMCEIFGDDVWYRYHRTSLGNPYAHDNGSGPHDQALAAAVMDPVNHPFDGNYGWSLVIHAALGDPTAEDIAVGDPEAVDRVTVGNHAGGGKTAAIKAGTLKRASPEDVEKARGLFRERVQAMMDKLSEGVVLVAA